MITLLPYNIGVTVYRLLLTTTLTALFTLPTPVLATTPTLAASPSTTPSPPVSAITPITPVDQPNVTAAAGATRIETAITVAQTHAYQRIVLTGHQAHHDMATALPYIARHHAALLLTPQDSLPATLKAYLTHYVPRSMPITIIGGPDVVSDHIANELVTLGFTPTRLAGPTLDETQTAITQALQPSLNGQLITHGQSAFTHIAAGLYAARTGQTLRILTGPTSLPATPARTYVGPTSQTAVANPLKADKTVCTTTLTTTECGRSLLTQSTRTAPVKAIVSPAQTVDMMIGAAWAAATGHDLIPASQLNHVRRDATSYVIVGGTSFRRREVEGFAALVAQERYQATPKDGQALTTGQTDEAPPVEESAAQQSDLPVATPIPDPPIPTEEPVPTVESEPANQGGPYAGTYPTPDPA